MGKVAVLDRIRDSAHMLYEKDTAAIRARYPETRKANEGDVAFSGIADGSWLHDGTAP